MQRRILFRTQGKAVGETSQVCNPSRLDSGTLVLLRSTLPFWPEFHIKGEINIDSHYGLMEPPT